MQLTSEVSFSPNPGPLCRSLCPAPPASTYLHLHTAANWPAIPARGKKKKRTRGRRGGGREQDCKAEGTRVQEEKAKKIIDRIGLTFYLMIKHEAIRSYFVASDIEAAADWRWVKILTASSKDAPAQPTSHPTSQQTDALAEYAGSQPAIGSQPARHWLAACFARSGQPALSAGGLLLLVLAGCVVVLC